MRTQLPLPQRGIAPNFWPISVAAKWLDQDATRQGARPRPRRLYDRWEPRSSPQKGGGAGTLKMRDMKQRERKQRRQNIPKCRGGDCEKRKQRHKVAGGGKSETRIFGKAEYGKPLIVKYMQTRTNNAVESFRAALRRRVKVAHPNLYTSLGHLQRATTDTEAGW